MLTTIWHNEERHQKNKIVYYPPPSWRIFMALGMQKVELLSVSYWTLIFRSLISTSWKSKSKLTGPHDVVWPKPNIKIKFHLASMSILCNQIVQSPLACFKVNRASLLSSWLSCRFPIPDSSDRKTYHLRKLLHSTPRKKGLREVRGGWRGVGCVAKHSSFPSHSHHVSMFQGYQLRNS